MSILVNTPVGVVAVSHAILFHPDVFWPAHERLILRRPSFFVQGPIFDVVLEMTGEPLAVLVLYAEVGRVQVSGLAQNNVDFSDYLRIACLPPLRDWRFVCESPKNVAPEVGDQEKLRESDDLTVIMIAVGSLVAEPELKVAVTGQADVDNQSRIVQPVLGGVFDQWANGGEVAQERRPRGRRSGKAEGIR
jgi:hypothetical protein